MIVELLKEYADRYDAETAVALETCEMLLSTGGSEDVELLAQALAAGGTAAQRAAHLRWIAAMITMAERCSQDRAYTDRLVERLLVDGKSGEC